MQIESEPPEEIEINMTSMIDIVFQLLVFFIMTFKVTAMEGDFSVKMPLASVSAEPSMDDEVPELIRVKLRAGEDGAINSITVDDDRDVQTFGEGTMYTDLTDYVETKLAGETNPEEGMATEVEFDIDYQLKYSYTVQAIESVSGRMLGDGSVKKLIQVIKFKDQPAG